MIRYIYAILTNNSYMKKLLLLLFVLSGTTQAQEKRTAQLDSILLHNLETNKADNGLIILRDLYNASNNCSTAFLKTKQGYQKNNSLIHEPMEPGSFMLPVTAAYLMDQFNIATSDSIDIQGGELKINGKIIYDSEKHGIRNASLKDIIAISSNVGIAKFLMSKVSSDEQIQIMRSEMKQYFSPMKLPITNINLAQLPQSSFGYGIELSPENILNFYSNIATNKEIFTATTTTAKVKSSLEEVMKKGTGKLLNSDGPSFAGKTATIQVMNENKYQANHYYSGFVGYFPKDNPTYSCIVIIKCRAGAPKYYGAAVAGPVFEEVVLKMSK